MTALFALIFGGLWSAKFFGALATGAAALLTIFAATYSALPTWLRRVLIYAGVLVVVASSGFYTGFSLRDGQAIEQARQHEIKAWNTAYAARKQAEAKYPAPKVKVPVPTSPPQYKSLLQGFLETLGQVSLTHKYQIPQSVCIGWTRITDADSRQVKVHNDTGRILGC